MAGVVVDVVTDVSVLWPLVVGLATAAAVVEVGVGWRIERFHAARRRAAASRRRAARWNAEFVYFVQRADGLVKIGWSREPGRRLAELRSVHGPLRVLGLRLGGWPAEQALHWRFARAHVDLEWFRPVPRLVRYAEGCRCALPEEAQAMAARLNADYAANVARVQRALRVTWYVPDSGGEEVVPGN